jgi:hypothetical protein
MKTKESKAKRKENRQPFFLVRINPGLVERLKVLPFDRRITTMTSKIDYALEKGIRMLEMIAESQRNGKDLETTDELLADPFLDMELRHGNEP